MKNRRSSVKDSNWKQDVPFWWENFCFGTSSLTCDGFLAKSREMPLSAIHEWLLYKGHREDGVRKRKPFKKQLWVLFYCCSLLNFLIWLKTRRTLRSVSWRQDQSQVKEENWARDQTKGVVEAIKETNQSFRENVLSVFVTTKRVILTCHA